MLKSMLKLFGLSKESKTDSQSAVRITKAALEVMNRPIYEQLTAEIIDSIPDDLLIQSVYDNLAQKFLKDKSEYETVVEFDRSQQAFYVIWQLEAEVNNGGFNQYFENSSGQFAQLTPSALELIGAPKFADLVKKANRIYADEEETITKYLDGTVEGFSKSYEDNPLNELDSAFFEYYKDEDLMQLQIDFIRRNKNDFVD